MFYGFAATEFGNYIDSTTLLEKVSSWVGTRLNYVVCSGGQADCRLLSRTRAVPHQ
jgi:hypothetical protein